MKRKRFRNALQTLDDRRENVVEGDEVVVVEKRVDELLEPHQRRLASVDEGNGSVEEALRRS